MARRSSKAEDASTQLSVSRHVCWIRAAVFIVSPISAISFLRYQREADG